MPRHECPGGHFAGGTTMPTTPVQKKLYSAPNDKLPKLTFSVIGLYLLNQSYLKQGNYFF